MFAPRPRPLLTTLYSPSSPTHRPTSPVLLVTLLAAPATPLLLSYSCCLQTLVPPLPTTSNGWHINLLGGRHNLLMFMGSGATPVDHFHEQLQSVACVRVWKSADERGFPHPPVHWGHLRCPLVLPCDSHWQDSQSKYWPLLQQIHHGMIFYEAYFQLYFIVQREGSLLNW